MSSISSQILNYLDNEDKIRKLLVELQNEISKIKSGEFQNNLSGFIIKSLFRNEGSLEKYKESTLYVINEFVNFLLDGNSAIVQKSHLIRKFIPEYQRFIENPNLFRKYDYSTILTQDHFYSIRSYFLIKEDLDDDSLFLLSTFGLRQTFEIKIKRILGVDKFFVIDGEKKTLTKIDHSVFEKFMKEIIDRRCKESLFSKDDLVSIQDIYIWTNKSIHMMSIPPVWLIWKAFDYVSILFRSSVNIIDSSISWSVYNSLIFDKDDFASLREEFVNLLYKKYCMSKNEKDNGQKNVVVKFKKPEIYVKGENNNNLILEISSNYLQNNN